MPEHQPVNAENDEGILAPKCPHCGWQAIDREDAPENYEAAKADVVEHKAKCPASTHPAEAGACVWPSTLRKVITAAIADAERAGMTGRTRDEWVSIAILASPSIPLGSHFPTEGGGDCPRCADHMRGTGGNRFIPADATRADLMRTINDQLGDLHEWAAETDQVFDLAEVTISTKRIPSGLISVSVTADLTRVIPPAVDRP